MKRAEDALKQEKAEQKYAKADPFTRTKGRPTVLVTKSKNPEIKAQIKQRYMNAFKPISTEDIAGSLKNSNTNPTKSSGDKVMFIKV